MDMRKRFGIAGLLLAMVLATVPVRASDPPVGHATSDHAAAAGHDEHGGDKPALLQWDIGTAVWSIVVFAVLLVILRIAAWKPILAGLQQREKFIIDSIAEAKRGREQAEKLLADYSAKIEKARLDATAIVEEGRRDAEALRRKIQEDTNHEVQEMLARARRDIKIAQDAAVKELSDRTLDLAASVASKIIRKQTTPADHRTLLDESIAELGRMNN
ncbi:MAG: F0F1 ATP synthase subunit B [Planctomycetes bacterium]|nr:F0F1 ATP synthase subunit B [Planctomycetota bacterium]